MHAYIVRTYNIHIPNHHMPVAGSWCPEKAHIVSTLLWVFQWLTWFTWHHPSQCRCQPLLESSREKPERRSDAPLSDARNWLQELSLKRKCMNMWNLPLTLNLSITVRQGKKNNEFTTGQTSKVRHYFWRTVWRTCGESSLHTMKIVTSPFGEGPRAHWVWLKKNTIAKAPVHDRFASKLVTSFQKGSQISAVKT